jgi:hypothetical protein
MNVNVLDPPPPWWWYLPLAFGTMFMTVSIWIIFKRNETVQKGPSFFSSLLLLTFQPLYNAIRDCADNRGCYSWRKSWKEDLLG